MRVLTMQSPIRRGSEDTRLPFDPSAPARYLERKPANFGDYVVIDSMLRVADVEVVGNVQFGSPPADGLPNVDHLIIRGANYIRSNLDLTGMGEIIERLGVPVTVMGIGAQAPRYGPLELPKGSIRALRILGEHSTVVGARGTYTAEVLKRLGIDNVEPVGCPSFFRALNRDLTISFAPERIRSVAFNMNRHMSGIYGADTIVINRMQRDFFLQLKRLVPTVRTFCQGELPEFIGAHRLENEYGIVRDHLARSGFANNENDPIIDDFIASAVCASTIREWERMVAANDLVIGMRFHGTTVGLSNGVASIYFVNDTRVHELASHFGVPYVDLRKFDSPPSIDSILELADFSAFNARYAERFDRFADYLRRNGLPSRMGSTARTSRLGFTARGAKEPGVEDTELHPRVDSVRSAKWLRSQLAWSGRRIGELQRTVDTTQVSGAQAQVH